MPLIGVLLYALVWALAACFPLTDSDIWWHLASGRDMLLQGHWLRQDPFTYSAAGASWINVHWLYQLVLYDVNNWGGSGALVALHSLAWGVTAWVWVRTEPKANFGWLWLLLPMVLSAHFLFLARPLVFTLLLLGLQRLLVVKYHRGGRLWLGLGLCQVVLANIQGLFLLGPILFVLFGLRDRQSLKILWAKALYLLVVSGLNPAGPYLWIYPLRLLRRLLPGNSFASNVSENVSPMHALVGGAWNGAATLWQALGLLVCTGLGLWIFWREPKSRSMLWVWGPLLTLAWLAERNIPLCYAICLPWIACYMPTPSWHAWSRWIGGVILFACLVGQGQWWFARPDAVAPFRFPQGASLFIARHAGLSEDPSRVFAEIRQSGYLTWRLYPIVQTYVDGRLILRDEAFFNRYLQYPTHPQEFFADLDRDSVEWVVLPVAYPPGWDQLAPHIQRNPCWQLVFLDECSWVYVRKNSSRAALEIEKISVQDSIREAFQARSTAWPFYMKREGEYWLGRAMFL